MRTDVDRGGEAIGRRRGRRRAVAGLRRDSPLPIPGSPDRAAAWSPRIADVSRLRCRLRDRAALRARTCRVWAPSVRVGRERRCCAPACDGGRPAPRPARPSRGPRRSPPRRGGPARPLVHPSPRPRPERPARTGAAAGAARPRSPSGDPVCASASGAAGGPERNVGPAGSALRAGRPRRRRPGRLARGRSSTRDGSATGGCPVDDLAVGAGDGAGAGEPAGTWPRSAPAPGAPGRCDGPRDREPDVPCLAQRGRELALGLAQLALGGGQALAPLLDADAPLGRGLVERRDPLAERLRVLLRGACVGRRLRGCADSAVGAGRVPSFADGSAASGRRVFFPIRSPRS